MNRNGSIRKEVQRTCGSLPASDKSSDISRVSQGLGVSVSTVERWIAAARLQAALIDGHR
jgi:hypothetical protein